MKPLASVREASLVLLERYAAILDDIAFDPPAPDGTSSAHLAWMCQTAITESAGWPADKLSRWLGFVQGVMASRGQITIDIDSEFSQPTIFSSYVAGASIPLSLAPTSAALN